MYGESKSFDRLAMLGCLDEDTSPRDFQIPAAFKLFLIKAKTSTDPRLHYAIEANIASALYQKYV
jgi:hypothetical protein